MAIYFNMDEKHLRKGGRKAPQISMARFLQIMQNRFTKFCAEYDIEIEPDAFQDPTEFNFYDVLYEELEDPLFLGKFIKDVSKINVNFENFDCVEADVGRNGVPYLLIRRRRLGSPRVLHDVLGWEEHQRIFADLWQLF